MIIRSHSVPELPSGLSPMQESLLRSEAFVRLVSAPTGSGKSYAFMRAVIIENLQVLFIVPTKRLIQNLIKSARNQAHHHLKTNLGWEEEQRNAWTNERIVEWSANQFSDGTESKVATRVRQFLKGVQHSDGFIVFAVPEVVINMISGIRIVGASTINPFFYVRYFDHIVFDEFHTIDDRAFGLASLMALLAAKERRGKISLMSATPIDVSRILAKGGVELSEIESISEKIVDGHPLEHRPIHGNVTISLDNSSLIDIVGRHKHTVKKSIRKGSTVVIIYDSLECLVRDELELREILKQVNIEDECILTISSIHDSKRKLGEPLYDKRYEDPSQYQILVCTSSVEVGVTFNSTLMFMEAGFGPASFVQRIGRVSRGVEDGQVIVSLPERKRSRYAWTRRIAATIEQYEDLTVEEFTKQILHDCKKKIEPVRTEIEAQTTGAMIPYYRRVSWRGVFWAALFIVAIRHLKMRVQSGASQRLNDISPGTVKFVDARIREILSVDTVNPNLRKESQPHRRWVNALLKSALTYRDIGESVRVVDPNGCCSIVNKYYLQRATDILSRYIPSLEDGEWTVHLVSRTLEEETREASRHHTTVPRLRLYVYSPIGDGDFEIVISKNEQGTEQFYSCLVTRWRQEFGHLVPESDGFTVDARRKVIGAATALVERLGRPPLDEDFECSEEGALFA